MIRQLIRRIAGSIEEFWHLITDDNQWEEWMREHHKPRSTGRGWTSSSPGFWTYDPGEIE